VRERKREKERERVRGRMGGTHDAETNLPKHKILEVDVNIQRDLSMVDTT
jgi:hypothetical protein